MSRQAGWYWVKEDALSPRWEAAEWCPEFSGWSVSANEEWVRDENLLAVGDRIPTPDEPWQCVPVPGTTGEMDDAVRGLLMLLSGGAPLTYERARRHVEMYHGLEALGSWPDYALEGDGHIPKAAQADLLYRMLIAAAPKPGGEDEHEGRR